MFYESPNLTGYPETIQWVLKEAGHVRANFTQNTPREEQSILHKIKLVVDHFTQGMWSYVESKSSVWFVLTIIILSDILNIRLEMAYLTLFWSHWLILLWRKKEVKKKK